MTELVIELSETLDQQLAEAAERSRTSKAALAQRALREFLMRQSNDREVTKTVADVAGHLFSSIDVAGPSDLSTKKDYLGDFGK